MICEVRKLPRRATGERLWPSGGSVLPPESVFVIEYANANAEWTASPEEGVTELNDAGDVVDRLGGFGSRECGSRVTWKTSGTNCGAVGLETGEHLFGEHSTAQELETLGFSNGGVVGSGRLESKMQWIWYRDRAGCGRRS